MKKVKRHVFVLIAILLFTNLGIIQPSATAESNSPLVKKWAMDLTKNLEEQPVLTKDGHVLLFPHQSKDKPGFYYAKFYDLLKVDLATGNTVSSLLDVHGELLPIEQNGTFYIAFYDYDKKALLMYDENFEILWSKPLELLVPFQSIYLTEIEEGILTVYLPTGDNSSQPYSFTTSGKEVRMPRGGTTTLTDYFKDEKLVIKEYYYTENGHQATDLAIIDLKGKLGDFAFRDLYDSFYYEGYYYGLLAGQLGNSGWHYRLIKVSPQGELVGQFALIDSLFHVSDKITSDGKVLLRTDGGYYAVDLNRWTMEAMDAELFPENIFVQNGYSYIYSGTGKVYAADPSGTITATYPAMVPEYVTAIHPVNDRYFFMNGVAHEKPGTSYLYDRELSKIADSIDLMEHFDYLPQMNAILAYGPHAFTVYQLTEEAVETVDPLKFWTVTFSSDVDPVSVTRQSIYVTDQHGAAVEGIRTEAIGDQVKVYAPQQGYRSGETYQLVVTQGVRSQSGTPLKEERVREFTVK